MFLVQEAKSPSYFISIHLLLVECEWKWIFMSPSQRPENCVRECSASRRQYINDCPLSGKSQGAKLKLKDCTQSTDTFDRYLNLFTTHRTLLFTPPPVKNGMHPITMLRRIHMTQTVHLAIQKAHIFYESGYGMLAFPAFGLCLCG